MHIQYPAISSMHSATCHAKGRVDTGLQGGTAEQGEHKTRKERREIIPWRVKYLLWHGQHFTTSQVRDLV